MSAAARTGAARSAATYDVQMADPKTSLVQTHPGHVYAPAIVFVSLGLNIAALLTPFLVMKKLIFFEEDYTLLHSVKLMWDNGSYVLAAIVFCFSVIFPFAKLGSLLWVWFIPMDERGRHLTLKIVGVLGKWSMLDVFIVALLIVLSTTQAMFDAEPRIGVYLFAGAIGLSLVASLLIEYIAKQASQVTPGEPTTTRA